MCRICIHIRQNIETILGMVFGWAVFTPFLACSLFALAQADLVPGCEFAEGAFFKISTECQSFWVFLSYSAPLTFGLIAGIAVARKIVINGWQWFIGYCNRCEARANAKKDTP